MTDVPDDRLLEQFTRDSSEEAFAALVQRHIALVHSVALRHTANPQHAEDITQSVFVILARKAGALGRKTVLPGWLYHTARLTAANLQRAETRRVRRDHEVFMQSKLEESPTDALWRELSPQLDEAMAGLGTSERDALVLRYFQNKSMAEVGKFLGLEENTAQKRVSRALEKLRKFFTKRGLRSTAAAIAENISANSVQAAPVALAKTVTAVAVAKGATASASTLTLIKGALKVMAWTKAKTAIAVGVGILLVIGTSVVTVKEIRERAFHTGRSAKAVNPLGFAVSMTHHQGRFGDFHANSLSIAVVTNQTPFELTLSGQTVQWKKPNGNIVSDDAAEWDGKNSSISLPPNEVAKLPFEIPSAAQSFRIVFEYDGDNGRLQRKYESVWMPKTGP